MHSASSRDPSRNSVRNFRPYAAAAILCALVFATVQILPAARADAACPCFDAAAIVQTCRELPIRSFTQWTRSLDRFALSCGPSKDWPDLAAYSVLWNASKSPGVYVQELSHNREKCSGPSTGGSSGDRSTTYRAHESCLAALRAAAKTLAIPLTAR